MERRTYRYYDLVMAAFVTVLVCSNMIGAAKVTTLWGFSFGGGVLFFPISYILGDILTEVYGYARTRKVVWAGFTALAYASFMSWLIVALSPADGYHNQAAIETIFGATPRIALASLVGECIDSMIFYPLAFIGVWENNLIIRVMIANYLLKVGWEIVNTPITYRVVAFLKRAEQEDYYDRNTNFTPFSLEA